MTINKLFLGLLIPPRPEPTRIRNIQYSNLCSPQSNTTNQKQMSPSTTSPVTGPHSTPGFQPDQNGQTNEDLTQDELQRSQLEDKLEQLLQTLLEVGICMSTSPQRQGD